MVEQFKDCKIISLYQKIPNNYTGSFLIEISYKKNNEDIFHSNINIKIDQSKFINDLLNFDFKEDERLYYTNGMADIDIYKRGKYYCIKYSPTKSKYFEFMFNKEEFNQLFNWIKIQKRLK